MRYFNLFSNIIITKGSRRILISDLQRSISELYPLELYEVTEELKNDSIENILSGYDETSKAIFAEYLNVLLDKEFGFITQNDWDKHFIPISLEHNSYSEISNIFLEMDDITILKKIRTSIENSDIKHLVIYAKKEIDLETFILIDETFSNSVLAGIEIISPYHNLIDRDFITQLHIRTSRFYSLIFYNCPKMTFKIKDEFQFVVNFTKENIKITSCGKVDLKYFNTNLPKVLEAINHNSCLHKKISIDINGNIKNCPSMPQSFGNIRDTTLEEAFGHKDFKKYWNLTKDNIEVCKDCEFRYICTDCRAYTEQTHTNAEGLDISKPLKCGYDPYTGEWKEWSINPLKQKAINYYGMKD